MKTVHFLVAQYAQEQNPCLGNREQQDDVETKELVVTKLTKLRQITENI